MPNIFDLSLEQLSHIMLETNQPVYRAKQIFNGIYNGKALSKINIPKTLAETLSGEYNDKPLEIIARQTSTDGTEKFLYKLFDNNIIEGVLLRQNYGNTLCVSTQVGCRMGCGFCASTVDGLLRNLSAGEIAAQVVCVNSLFSEGKERAVKNIVLMGSGEPLDNYDNVIKFLRLISDVNGINISLRNVSLSTCGIVPKIYQLADLNLGITLSLSLHSPYDEKRKSLMPIAKKYSIQETVDALKYYFDKTGRRVIIEYSLIEGENCSINDAIELKKILSGLACHINLIRLNKVKERDLSGATAEASQKFYQHLKNLGMSVTIRRQTGTDIDGSCGQLRNKFVGDNPPVSSDKKP